MGRKWTCCSFLREANNRWSLPEPREVQTIEAGQVALRFPHIGDGAALHRARMRSRYDIARWQPDHSSPYPQDAAVAIMLWKKYVAEVRRQMKDGDTVPFVITIDDEPVGEIILTDISRAGASRATLGYWMDSLHTGQGITTAAVRLALNYAFVTMSLQRIQATVVSENPASQAILRKNGFQKEGVLRQYFRIRGNYVDHEMWSCCRSDISPL